MSDHIQFLFTSDDTNERLTGPTGYLKKRGGIFVTIKVQDDIKGP